VGALANVVPILLPPSVALLKQRVPGINVILREGVMRQLLPQLLLGELDLVVGKVTEMNQTNELGVRILSEEPLVPIVGPHHPLAGARDLQWSDLKSCTWILPPVDGLLRELFECTLESHGMAMPNDYIEAVSINFLISYLQLGNAIATTTRDTAEYYQRLGQATILNFDFPKMIRVLALAWNRQRPLSRGTIALMECLDEVVKAPQMYRDGAYHFDLRCQSS
jgi:DNA-binding transcriptional LysR family regulator